jgi:hypothetical protein
MLQSHNVHFSPYSAWLSDYWTVLIKNTLHKGLLIRQRGIPIESSQRIDWDVRNANSSFSVLLVSDYRHVMNRTPGYL